MNDRSPRRTWLIDDDDGRDDGAGLDDGDVDGRSDGSLEILSGGEVTVWSTIFPGRDGRPEYDLRLIPDRPVVVGRSEGEPPEYLDPAYRPTRIVPGTGQGVLHSSGTRSDLYVSRAHFMLRAIASGILFVNGVPRRGGGTRPPVNGTHLVVPDDRDLDPGEEYLIASGTRIIVLLPNGSTLRIQAG